MIWLSMSLSKKYDKIYNFPIVFENIPIEKKPESDSLILKTTINATGWDIMFKKLKNRKVIIDLNQYPKNNSINFSNTKSIIQEQYSDVIIKEVNPSFFDLNFDILKTKKYPININLEENFPPNYHITNLTMLPDSVLATGDDESLRITRSIESVLLKINEKDTLIENVSLISNNDLKLEIDKVTVSFNIEEFVEKEFIVPINIENNNEDLDLIIYPQEIGLKCLVPIKIYENILASDFYISADFNNIEVRNDNRLILNIKSKPKSVKNIQLEKDRVEYIIYQ